jgi:hypothetical protein
MNMLARGWDQGPFIFAVIFGAFAFPLYALCAAHMNDSVEDNGFVEASSGLLLLYGAGAVAGPLIASPAMGYFGPAGLFGFTALVHSAMAAFAFYRMYRRDRPLAEDREPFADSLVVAQTVATIDPRTHDEEGEDSKRASSAKDAP